MATKRKKNFLKRKKLHIQHKNWHHTFPTSRFVLKKDIRLHNAWHHLFYNKDTESVKFYLDKLVKTGKFAEIINKPEWKLIFGEVSDLKEIKRIIDLEWRHFGIVGVPIPEEIRAKKNLFSINLIYEPKRIVIELKEEVSDGQKK